MPSFLSVTSLSNIYEVSTVSGTELFFGDPVVIDNCYGSWIHGAYGPVRENSNYEIHINK